MMLKPKDIYTNLSYFYENTSYSNLMNNLNEYYFEKQYDLHIRLIRNQNNAERILKSNNKCKHKLENINFGFLFSILVVIIILNGNRIPK